MYFLREMIPRHYLSRVYTSIKELCYGKTSMISFRLDDDRSSNYSLRFMALSRYLSETYNTNIYNINDLIFDFNQKIFFLNKQIYTYEINNYNVRR